MKIKTLLFLLTLLVSIFLVTSNFSVVHAQMMLPVTTDSVSQTQKEELEGKKIYDNLKSQAVTCDKLSDEDFERLGEYFMGQSIGNTERHAVMNQMMKNMMSEDGEEQMHITLGKRASGCDTNAPLSSGYGMPMMWWMMGSVGSPQVGGGGSPMMGYGGWGGMMNSWGGFGIMGWLTMIIFWILIVLGVVALVRYLGGTRKDSTDKDKTPLDILKERYAKGEIDKKEFEDKKKDLG